jgi:PAS domain S-box-containing protein
MYVNPSHRETMVKLLREKGEVRNFESQEYNKNHDVIWVSSDIRLVRNSEGQALYFEGFVRDITKYKLADELLKQSMVRYQTLIESMNEGVLQVNTDDLIEETNSRFCQMTGYAKDELVGRVTSQIFLRPEDYARMEEKNEMRKKGIPGRYEIEIRNKANEYFWAEISAAPVYGPKGNFAGSIALMTDISERKLSEALVQESEKRYRELVNQGLGFICTHDTDGVLLSINPSAAQSLGYRVDEMIGKNLAEFLHPSVQKSMKKYLELIQKNTIVNGVMIMRTKSGEEQIWNYHNVMQLEENHKPYVLGHAHDITERMKAEKEREKLISELQDALSKIKTLSGLLPICSSCKKVRDDQGYWHQIENYISEHSEADFTHGICQECAKKLYPEIYSEDDSKKSS